MDYKLIPLTKNKFAKISPEDFDKVKQKSWCLHSAGYAHGKVNGKVMRMHRFILDVLPNQDIDHINGDKLDNRRENLRLCNNTLNAQNRSHRNTNIYGFKGISYAKRDNRWQAEIQVNGIKKYLGYFKTAYEAAQAYNNAASQYFGEFAKLNNI